LPVSTKGNRLGEISSDTLSRRAVLSASEWTSHHFDFPGRARTDGLAGVSTGLRDLDTMTLGDVARALPAGRIDGHGQDGTAGQIALHVGEHHGPVMFGSMELTDVDLAVRLVSVLTNIRNEWLITGLISRRSRSAFTR